MERSGNIGGGQVYLVDDGKNLEIMLEGEIHVRKGLRLNALRGVDEQQRAFARGDRARNLIGKVHVAGRVDEI